MHHELKLTATVLNHLDLIGVEIKNELLDCDTWKIPDEEEGGYEMLMRELSMGHLLASYVFVEAGEALVVRYPITQEQRQALSELE